MERFKFDNARKQITLKDRVSFGKVKVVKAKDLEYFTQSNNFDKHLSEYYNKGGLTYVFSNPVKEQEEDYEMTIKSKIATDEELKNRYFAGMDEARKIEIQEIKEEYGL